MEGAGPLILCFHGMCRSGRAAAAREFRALQGRRVLVPDGFCELPAEVWRPLVPPAFRLADASYRAWFRADSSSPPLYRLLDGSLQRAAAELGLKPKTLRARLERGMSLDDALRPPRSTKRVRVGANDAALAEVAAQAGVSYNTVRRRLAEGKSPEQVTAPRYYRETCSREAISALLASSTTPMTRMEIARALGFHEDAVRQHLDRMRRDGGIACERSDAGPRPLLYSPAAVDMHPADKT